MKRLSQAVFTVLSVSALANGHMQMSDPPPLLSKYNKYTTNQDYDMTTPLSADGSNFPCRGHLNVLGSSQAQPVADWTPGQSYSMTISGQTPHNGGSCQSSLSFDNGKTWKVIQSYIGNCPVMGDSKYEFTLPGDTPSGNMLFAWTWFNNVGNREMYMNCAVINVQDGAGKKKRRGSSQSLTSRPAMFVANVGNGCTTVEGKDTIFPDPGPDVDMDSKNTSPPVGNCGPSSDSAPSDTSSSSSSGSSPDTISDSSSPASSKSSPQEPESKEMSMPTPPPVKHFQRPATNTSTTWYGMSQPPTMSTMLPLPSKPPTPPSSGCKPGTYSCTTGSSGTGDGWQVCDVSGKQVVSDSSRSCCC